VDKKQAKLDYKMTHRPMGVFQIRNKVNEKVFVDSSLNIPGKVNRLTFQLNAGSHPSRSLQADWNELGKDAFDFETLEDLPPRSDSGYNYAADLETLEDLWLEKLEPYDSKGYNERKKTREERLRMIAANRKF
jgi:hypothetical protein